MQFSCAETDGPDDFSVANQDEHITPRQIGSDTLGRKIIADLLNDLVGIIWRVGDSYRSLDECAER
jgi:hypothetical protein